MEEEKSSRHNAEWKNNDEQYSLMPLRKNKTSQNYIGKEKALIDIYQTDKEVPSGKASEIGAGVLSMGGLSLELFRVKIFMRLLLS